MNDIWERMFVMQLMMSVVSYYVQISKYVLYCFSSHVIPLYQH